MRPSTSAACSDAGEDAQLDEPRLALVVTGETLERLVNADEIDAVAVGLAGGHAVERDPLPAAAAFGSIVDMGAYEFQVDGADTCPTDIDGNEVTDFGDVLAVLSGWGSCPE